MVRTTSRITDGADGMNDVYGFDGWTQGGADRQRRRRRPAPPLLAPRLKRPVAHPLLREGAVPPFDQLVQIALEVLKHKVEFVILSNDLLQLDHEGVGQLAQTGIGGARTGGLGEEEEVKGV